MCLANILFGSLQATARSQLAANLRLVMSYFDGPPAALPRAGGRRPDLVERVLVIRKHPTLGDLVVGDAKDPYRLPGRGHTVALHLASGKDDRALIVGKHAAHDDAKRRLRQLASCDEVVQDLIPAPIVASYAAAPRHVPRDVLGEHRAHVLLAASGIEAVLGVVELADQLGAQMHFESRAVSRLLRVSGQEDSLRGRLTRAEFAQTNSGQSAVFVANVPAMPRSSLSLIEFPADDPERARRFWEELLSVELEARKDSEGEGWQTRSGAPAVGVHARGRGPGDSLSLPYFAVIDVAEALERVEALGGSVVHPGERWAICRDSEGSPFGLTAESLGT